jgi:hypothetical protein
LSTDRQYINQTETKLESDEKTNGLPVRYG